MRPLGKLPSGIGTIRNRVEGEGGGVKENRETKAGPVEKMVGEVKGKIVEGKENIEEAKAGVTGIAEK